MEFTWEAVAAISSVVSTFLLLGSFAFLAGQVREARKAAIGQAFLGIVASVQSEDMRAARGHVFRLEAKPVSQWTDEDRACVERVCQSFDVFGIVCRYGLVPTRLVATEWGNTIIRLWEITKPYVLEISQRRYSKNYWRHFEWLDGKARKLSIHKELVKKITRAQSPTRVAHA